MMLAFSKAQCFWTFLLIPGLLADVNGREFQKREVQAPNALTLRITKNRTADIASTLYGYMWEVRISLGKLVQLIPMWYDRRT